MAIKKETKEIDTSTEDKIKEAARVVFHKKGYAATRTRDIAEEAGINLSLLNYYFRSKEKLFEIIMLETMGVFVNSMIGVLNDEKTTLIEKVEIITHRYIDTIKEQPEIPGFIAGEIRNNVGNVLEKIPVSQIINNSFLVKQYKAEVESGRIRNVSHIQFIMNVLGLNLFPFIAQPLIMGGADIKNNEFDDMLEQRKKLIPIWIEAMLKA